MALSVQANLQAAQALGVDRLDAQMLLLHALQKPTHDRAWLLSHDTDVLTQDQRNSFEHLTQRRLQGEPTAYLVGEKAFFGLTLCVDSRVLVPRPDTECLVEWALAAVVPLAHPKILDLGTGSGAIGLAIKSERPDCDITLLDASQAALDVACANAASLRLSVRGLRSDWFVNLSTEQDQFDLIVSNPPYIAEGDKHMAALCYEPVIALTSGADGLDAIRRIVHDAPRHLNAGGWLLIEHGYDQAQAVRELLEVRGFESVSSRQDLNGIERCSGGFFR